MEDIQVGEYVRTKYGVIYRAQDNIVINENMPKKLKQLSGTIVNHSFNIIDLLQPGDYVNGYKVDFVQNNEVIYNHNHPRQLNIFAKNIKSIVTKEQFSSIEYKAKEE